MSNVRMSRLFSIIGYLSPHSQITIPDLAKEYEVSKRTIRRDIEVLQNAQLGIFIEKNRIRISRIGYKKIRSWMLGAS